MRENLTETREVVVGSWYHWEGSSIDIKDGEIVEAHYNETGMYYNVNREPRSPENPCGSSVRALKFTLDHMYTHNYNEFCQMLKTLNKDSLGYSIAKEIIESDLAVKQSKLNQLENLLK